MYTDIILGSQIATQINDSVVIPYTPYAPMFNLQRQDFDNKLIKILTPFVDTALDETQAMPLLVQDTEMFHIKVGTSSFTYTPKLLARQINRATEFQSYNAINMTPISAQVLKKWFQVFDQMAIFGANNEVGLTNNPNITTLASTAVPDINALLSAIEAIKQAIMLDTTSQEEEIHYWFSGPVLRALLAKTTGSTPVLNTSLVDQALTNADGWDILPSFLDPSNTNQIIAFIPSQIELYYFQEPEVWKSGFNDERNYAWLQYFMSNSAVNILNKAAVKMPVTAS